MVDEVSLEHLVVAWFEDGTSGNASVYLLKKAIRTLGTKGAVSIVINREHGQAVLCSFELKEDADRLARAMKARRIDKYPGWKSQRGFSLDKVYIVAKDLADRSPRPRPRPRPQ